MLFKKIAFLYFVIILTKTIPLFCMLEESTFEWSTYFENKEEKYEKSFVFDINDEYKKIILVQTSKNIYVFISVDNTLKKLLLHQAKMYQI